MTKYDFILFDTLLLLSKSTFSSSSYHVHTRGPRELTVLPPYLNKVEEYAKL